MKLISFRIRDFKSIIDSGNVEIGKLTALVGKNESGKTNVLYALERLRTPSGMDHGVDVAADFPLTKTADSINYDIDIVEGTYELDTNDQKAVAEVWPRGGKATTIKLSRRYSSDGTTKTTCWFSFQGMQELSYKGDPKTAFHRALSSLRLGLSSHASRRAAAERIKALLQNLDQSLELKEWKPAAEALLKDLTDFIKANAILITNVHRNILSQLRAIVENADDDVHMIAAADLLIARQNPFLYLDEYPDIPGSQNIKEYLAAKRSGNTLASHEAFTDFIKVAGLDVDELETSSPKDVSKHKRALNEAGRRLTQRIRQYWRGDPLTIRIDTAAGNIDIFVTDPSFTDGAEINLEDRSRGFQWFFGFIVAVAAQALTDDRKSAILLLDEAGLHLHPGAQRHLLEFLETLPNQIIYTTHLPFMLPSEPKSIKGVQYDAKHHTTVENEIDRRSTVAHMLQRELGYQAAEMFLLSDADLLVEGVTDYWILHSVSNLLNAKYATGLDPSVALTPCHGYSKTAAWIALFQSNGVRTAVLFDSSDETRKYASDEIVKTKLLRSSAIFYVGDLFSPKRTEADIEDLFPDDVYELCVAETHDPDIVSSLKLNAKVPRIAARYEQGFIEAGDSFSKVKTAKSLAGKILRGEVPLTDAQRTVFETLFRAIESEQKAQTHRETFR